MMHIVDMDWDQDSDLVERFQRLDRENERGEACDDDIEVDAPWINILPEETDAEEPSPLRFNKVPEWHYIDRDIALALKLGL
jgi:hypothetical protein